MTDYDWSQLAGLIGVVIAIALYALVIKLRNR